MNRILGTLFAATLLTACGQASPGTLDRPDPASPIGDPGTLPAAKPAWTQLGNTPAPRSGHTAVYDRARDRMLVLGGSGNDLWAQSFSGPNENGWQRIEVGGDVPPPIGLTAVIDEAKNQLLVFPSDSLDRAWTLPLDGSGPWHLVGFGAAPKIALGFSLAMDPAGHRLYAYTSGQPEVWTLALDGSGIWERLAGPPGQSSFSCRDTLVFDQAHARLLVLSGGWPRGEVYALALGADPTWSKLNTGDAWFSYGASMIYDAKARRFLVRSQDAKSWLWSFAVDDETGTWTHLKVSSGSHAQCWDSSAIYDSRQDRLVMFGGRTDDAERSLHNDTWALSLGDAPAWSGVGALDDAAPASDGTMLAVVKDPGSVIRFGGASANGALASGVFDAKTARFLPLGDAPSAQASWGAGAWDPAGQRLMTFGGYGYTDESQTWSLDLDASAWTDVSSKSAGPEARNRHSMVSDPGGARMLVFGGMRSSGYPETPYFNDTWALSTKDDSWTALDIAGPKPSGRAGHAAAFDDEGQRMFVYGGMNATAQLGDAWMLELAPAPHWVELHPSGNPPPSTTDYHAAFDPATHRFFVVATAPTTSPGSADGSMIWALTADAAPRWEHFCPTGTRPGRADGAVWLDGGLFVTTQGSSWRFDPSTPTCD